MREGYSGFKPASVTGVTSGMRRLLPRRRGLGEGVFRGCRRAAKPSWDRRSIDTKTAICGFTRFACRERLQDTIAMPRRSGSKKKLDEQKQQRVQFSSQV